MSSPSDGTIDEWWLDESALPHLLWARLTRGQDGIMVHDTDGRLHLFKTVSDAAAWLRQDEYESLSQLKQDGVVAADLLPQSHHV